MDFNRKKELINKLIDEMRNMEYFRGSSNLSDFQATGEVILNKVFNGNSSHLEKFKKVKFTPSMLVLGVDNTDSYISSFKRGRTSMISVLNGALKEIELEEEFFPSTPSLPLDTEVIESSRSNKDTPTPKKSFFTKHPFISGVIVLVFGSFIMMFTFWGDVIVWIENLFK